MACEAIRLFGSTERTIGYHLPDRRVLVGLTVSSGWGDLGTSEWRPNIYLLWLSGDA